MTKSKIGGAKTRAAEVVKIAIMIIMFVLFMVPFVLVLINSFKTKRDIILSPFSVTPQRGLTVDNYTSAFHKMNFLQAFGNSLFITTLATIAVILLSAMLSYYIVRAKNVTSKVMYSVMIASMIIPF